MPSSPSDSLSDRVARLRSGTAARLAGLPVTTLRVWERRYGVVAASKTVTGQRLYSQHDVARLRLLRQLSHSGHPIGTIATLELELLQELLAGEEAADAVVVPGRRSAVIVGRSAAQSLEAAAACTLRAVFNDLEQAELQAETGLGADLLVVRMASLQPPAVARILALARALGAATTVVVYAFGAEASAEGLRSAGAVVRREPITGRELARLVQGAGSAQAPQAATWSAAPPRFTDDDLAALAVVPSPIACECLRHLAEIVTQLGGFERYSQECTSRNPADAALHLHLSGLAGEARTAFEQALQRVIDDEGIVVPGHGVASIG